MEQEDIIEKLHPLERKVLPLLDRLSSFDDIVVQSKLKDVEVMRALQWLQNKKIINIKEEVKEIVSLSKNGKAYLKKGLPDKTILKPLFFHCKSFYLDSEG